MRKATAPNSYSIFSPASSQICSGPLQSLASAEAALFDGCTAPYQGSYALFCIYSATISAYQHWFIQ